MGGVGVDFVGNLLLDFANSYLLSQAHSSLLSASLGSCSVVFLLLLGLGFVCSPLEFSEDGLLVVFSLAGCHVTDEAGDVLDLLLESEHVLDDLSLELREVLALE